MIAIKNERELSYMRQACKITAAARALAGEMVRPGVSTRQIDKAVHDYIVSQGAKPSFLNYHGYPASACISVNATVIHGIPGGYILKEGDIVSVDVGAFYKGFHGDCAATFPCGKISAEAQKLINEAENILTDEARHSLFKRKMLEHVEGIVAASVKPLEKIQDIRIMSVDGMGGVGGTRDGSPTDEVINSALRYRVQAPLIDSLLSDIGIEGGSLAKQGGLIREASDMQRIADAAKKAPKEPK